MREVIDGMPTTASGLRIRLGDGAADRIAHPSWARTLPLSVAKSRGNVFAKSSQFVARALRELHALGPAWIHHHHADGFPCSFGKVPACPSSVPSPVIAMRFMRSAWSILSIRSRGLSGSLPLPNVGAL